MRRLPPLNALRVFDAAARRLNFSAAAEDLCVTHSAVSHQMRQLEDWLGCKLFVRHAGGVRLTPAGERLHGASSVALDQLALCCQEIAQGESPSELVVGAPGSFLANWLIPRLPRFEARRPNIRLNLRTCGEFAPLEQGGIDVLLVSGRHWPRAVAARRLFADSIGPVCAPALVEKLRQPADVVGELLLHTRSCAEAWPDWAEALGLAAPAFGAGRKFDHLPLMLEAAAAAIGVGVAPKLLVEREIESGRLIAPFGFVPCGAVFACCLLKTRADEPALREFSAWLAEEAAPIEGGDGA